jgi:cytochrome c biogenesis protein CcdA
MTLPLLASLSGIAFVDALNPSLFVAQFFLLTTPKPTARILSYIAGILTVYYFGGLLVLAGVRTLIAGFLESLSPTAIYGIQGVIGVLCIVIALRVKMEVQFGDPKKPISLRPIHTFVLGMVVMGNELTTALPYLVAIEQIAQARLTFLETLFALGLYNLIFSLPLFIFLGLALHYRERFATQLERINLWMKRWIPRILKYGTLIFGIVLSLNAASWFVTGRGLFG